MRAWLLLALLPAAGSAAETAAFLKLGVGARALGMGGAYTAVAADPYALSWNPAGLAQASKRELGLMHAELPLGSRYDFLGYAHPTSQGTWAGSAAYLNHGSLEGRDASGAKTGSFSAGDSAFSLGFAHAFSGTRLGGAVKAIRSEIAGSAAQTVAFDLGAQRGLGTVGPGSVSLGASAQNLGPGLRYGSVTEPLPVTLSLGTAYRFPAGLALALDVRHRPNARDTEVALGTEYAFLPQVAVRAGYGGASASASGSTPLRGFAAGVGLGIHGYTLDYAVTPFGDLGQVQRVSLGARF